MRAEAKFRVGTPQSSAGSMACMALCLEEVLESPMPSCDGGDGSNSSNGREELPNQNWTRHGSTWVCYITRNVGAIHKV